MSFNQRSSNATLPASTVTGVAGDVKEVLGAVACSDRAQSAWRTVDLWSQDGSSAWEAEIGWAAGAAGMRSVKVVVKGATRVSINASTIYVKGAALSASDVVAWAAISDGAASTENEWVVRGTTSDKDPAIIAVPTFAKFVRLELADKTLLATTDILLYDGWNTLRSQTQGNQQPNPGLPVGDASKVHISATASATAYRVTFLLHV